MVNILRSTNIKSALKDKQKGFLLNPFRMAPPPSTSDPYWANVSLLLHCEGLNAGTVFTDSSSVPKTVVISNVTTSTVKFKFGGASALIGTSGYLECANSPAFDLGTGDFTIELFANSVNTPLGSYGPTWFDGRTAAGGGNGPVLYTDGSTSKVLYWAAGANRITGGVVTGGAWIHIALSRSASLTRLFMDGVQQGVTVSDTYNFNGMRSRVASNFALTSGVTLIGNMDDIRITKGIGRYTTNFTPISTAFPDY